MSYRTILTTIAAIAALFALSACGNQIDGTPVPAPTTAVTPAPTSDTPPLPLPTTDSGELTNIIEDAYLAALDDRGINLTRQEALHAAEVSCQAGGLFSATRAVQRATGLSQSDAAYLVGAALMTCGGDGLQ